MHSRLHRLQGITAVHARCLSSLPSCTRVVLQDNYIQRLHALPDIRMLELTLCFTDVRLHFFPLLSCHILQQFAITPEDLFSWLHTLLHSSLLGIRLPCLTCRCSGSVQCLEAAGIQSLSPAESYPHESQHARCISQISQSPSS